MERKNEGEPQSPITSFKDALDYEKRRLEAIKARLTPDYLRSRSETGRVRDTLHEKTEEARASVALRATGKIEHGDIESARKIIMPEIKRVKEEMEDLQRHLQRMEKLFDHIEEK